MVEMILCYERAEWGKSQELAEELGIEPAVMAQVYMECVDEVNDIWENIVKEMEKKSE